MTHRFASADTHESGWQEQVIGHLGLPEWLRIDAGEELGCLGPVATAALRRHGLLWPCNAYFHAPLLDAAAGGSLLTGVGGDEAFGASTWERPLAVLRGAARPRPRDVVRVGFALAPAAVKRPVIRRRLPALAPWLRPDARRAVEAAIAATPRASRCAGGPATARCSARRRWTPAWRASARWPPTATSASPIRSPKDRSSRRSPLSHASAGTDRALRR